MDPDPIIRRVNRAPTQQRFAERTLGLGYNCLTRQSLSAQGFRTQLAHLFESDGQRVALVVNRCAGLSLKGHGAGEISLGPREQVIIVSKGGVLTIYAYSEGQANPDRYEFRLPLGVSSDLQSGGPGIVFRKEAETKSYFEFQIRGDSQSRTRYLMLDQIAGQDEFLTLLAAVIRLRVRESFPSGSFMPPELVDRNFKFGELWQQIRIGSLLIACGFCRARDAGRNVPYALSGELLCVEISRTNIHYRLLGTYNLVRQKAKGERGWSVKNLTQPYPRICLQLPLQSIGKFIDALHEL